MNSVLFTHICFFRLYVCMYQLSISCAFEYFYRYFRYDTMCIINHIYTGSNFDLRMKVNFKQLKVPVSDYLPAQTFWFLHLEVIVRKRNKIQKQTTLTFMYIHSSTKHVQLFGSVKDIFSTACHFRRVLWYFTSRRTRKINDRF